MSFANRFGKVWINVASGKYVFQDFVNLDSSPFLAGTRAPRFLRGLLPSRYKREVEDYEIASRQAQLIWHDCRRSLPFAGDSVDHILCSHFLEHLYVEEAQHVTREFSRCLRSGGTAHVIVPDLEAAVRAYVEHRGESDASRHFITMLGMTEEARPSLLKRMLEVAGTFGLQHRWMYDRASLCDAVIGLGLEVLEENETPSREWRRDDPESLHIVMRKP